MDEKLPRTEKEARERLGQVEHIVVLMMENRSFDHMLGYLSLRDGHGERARPDIDGLTGPDENYNEFDGRKWGIAPMREGEGITKVQDPGHTGVDVGQQMAHGMSGFVRNYMTTRAYQDERDVMRYQTADEVPIYDFLARNFALLDRWFCSVPGSTWPNRLASLCGEADQTDNQFPPIYSMRSFVQTLDKGRHGVTWRWYSSDPGSLRIADDHYRIGFEDNFAYAEKPTFLQKRTFYTDCLAEELPQVSWIDPNFVDLGGLQGANDDHPPTDVMSGQSFVMKIYQALTESALWEKSMLVITYDEHGGFYDHVDPTDASLPHEFRKRAQFRHFGPRVPAIVVSPFVDPGVAFGSRQAGEQHHARYLFDHTALIKTILVNFAKDDCKGLPERVDSSSHLGWVLRDGAREEDHPPRIGPEAETVAEWWSENIKFRLLHPTAAVPALQELGLVEGPAGPQAAAQTVATLIGKALDWVRERLGLQPKRKPPTLPTASVRHEPREKLKPVARVRRAVEEAAAESRRKGTPLPGELTEASELERGVAAAARYIRGQGLPSGRP